jgi:hypothetical protein
MRNQKLRERDVHIAIVSWFNLQYPKLKDDFHHFANERKCSIVYGALLKRMGVKAGVSDFHLAIASGGFHGLWMELKVEKGKLSLDQSKFLERKRARGYCGVAVWGFEEATETIVRYLNLLDASSANSPEFILEMCA